MAAHVRAHNGEKNFKCEVCAKAFVEKSHLTRHQKIHSDTFDFACTECKFRTKRKDKLKVHMVKIHSVKRESKLSENIAKNWSL